MKAVDHSTEGQAAPATQQSHSSAAPGQGLPLPNEFRISIRSHGKRWDAIVIHAVATNIGGFRNGAAGKLERPGQLKDEPEARLEFEIWPAQVGSGVTDVAVVMDLDACCDRRGTFDNVMSAARKMADTLGAELADRQGQPLTPETLATERERVDQALAERRRNREVLDVQPDGTVIKRGPVPFRSELCTKRGRYIETRHFDAPELEWIPGAIHGYEQTLQLLKLLARQESVYTHHQNVKQLLRDAGAAGDPSFKHSTKGNVAASVLDVAAHALFFFAQHANFEKFLGGMIESKRRHVDWIEEHEKQAKAEFVERMRAARARKARTAKRVRHG